MRRETRLNMVIHLSTTRYIKNREILDNVNCYPILKKKFAARDLVKLYGCYTFPVFSLSVIQAFCFHSAKNTKFSIVILS
jgi:hypothetical protein